MKLHFITGNAGKFREMISVLPEIEQLDIDLDEIQEVDSQKVIQHKLQQAQQHHAGHFIVEDVSLVLLEMNGLPGPLIKWFLKTVGIDGIAQMASQLPTQAAEAKTTIGYCDVNGNTSFFEGVVTGSIVAPRGKTEFGWDPIFMPDGDTKTFGEMEWSQKELYSPRKIAALKLKAFLEQS